jgi:polyisoprenyl-teichoic acid--peptidoglycan teichoic acid transferase
MQTYAPAKRPYQVPEPEPPGRHDPRWARILLIIGIVIVIAAGLFVGAAKAFDLYAGGKVNQEHLLPPGQVAKDISGPINILLLGMDERANTNNLIHTDSIIIVHVNAAHNSVAMVSVPRDAMVNAPPFPASRFPGQQTAKLTDVFAFGNRTFDSSGGEIGDNSKAGRTRGVTLLTEVLNSLVPGGIKFNAVAIVNYVGFTKLVTALGGVTMCIDEDTWSEHFNKDGKYVGETHGYHSVAKFYPHGCRHLLPWEALDYVRQRHYLANEDGDYGRQRHQQQFLTAVFKEMLSSKTISDPKKLTGIINSAGDLLTLDLGGNKILDWIFTLRGIRSSDITTIKTNAGHYASQRVNNTSYEMITPTMTELLQAIHDDAIDAFLTQHPDWISPPNTG